MDSQDHNSSVGAKNGSTIPSAVHKILKTMCHERCSKLNGGASLCSGHGDGWRMSAVAEKDQRPTK